MAARSLVRATLAATIGFGCGGAAFAVCCVGGALVGGPRGLCTGIVPGAVLGVASATIGVCVGVQEIFGSPKDVQELWQGAPLPDWLSPCITERAAVEGPMPKPEPTCATSSPTTASPSTSSTISTAMISSQEQVVALQCDAVAKELELRSARAELEVVASQLQGLKQQVAALMPLLAVTCKLIRLDPQEYPDLAALATTQEPEFNSCLPSCSDGQEVRQLAKGLASESSSSGGGSTRSSSSDAGTPGSSSSDAGAESSSSDGGSSAAAEVEHVAVEEEANIDDLVNEQEEEGETSNFSEVELAMQARKAAMAGRYQAMTPEETAAAKPRGAPPAAAAPVALANVPGEVRAAVLALFREMPPNRQLIIDKVAANLANLASDLARRPANAGARTPKEAIVVAGLKMWGATPVGDQALLLAEYRAMPC